MVEKTKDITETLFKTREEMIKASKDLLNNLSDYLVSYISAKGDDERRKLGEKIMDESTQFLKALPGVNRLLSDNEEEVKEAFKLYVLDLYPSIAVYSASGHRILNDNTLEVVKDLSERYMSGDASNNLLTAALENKFKFGETRRLIMLYFGDHPWETAAFANREITRDILSDVRDFLTGLVNLSSLPEDVIKVLKW